MSSKRENWREDVAGRANVEDTPELLAYYDQLEGFNAGALWTVANKIEPWEPKSQSVPVVWRYKDLRDIIAMLGMETLSEADRHTSFEGTARRVVPRLGNRTARDVNATARKA